MRPATALWWPSWATAANGQARNVMAHKLGLICNVKDYLTKVMPATTVLTPAGNYVNNVLPIPTEIFPTTELAEGKAILGLLDLYKFFAGSGPEGVIEYDDSVKFLAESAGVPDGAVSHRPSAGQQLLHPAGHQQAGAAVLEREAGGSG